ncbi:MAG: 2-dehydropantoate 2-reductase [Rhodospirillaceae bacterium]|nr:2-dehydropantoate 2-reductase [Rhodospirillaceae bacterium]
MKYRKVCIVGPGAIGGMMAVMLSRAGVEVSALARKTKSDAINEKGIHLLFEGQMLNARIKAAADPAALGPQDLLVVTLKSNALPAVAASLAPLCTPTTPIVFAMNGVPWWFFDGFGGTAAGSPLKSLDTDGGVRRAIPTERVIWGVINNSVHENPDGTLEHTNAQHIALGRPNDDPAGLEEVAAVFRPGGYKTVISPNIRKDLWVKLMINITMNPISALTYGTVKDLLEEPLVMEGVRAVAAEAQAVALKLGLDVPPAPLDKMRPAPVKTSMLQDLERGRPLELASIVEAVVEIAERIAVPMPQTRTLLGMMRLRSKTAGLV